ncbi:hypothetical protein CDEST_02590 [Colletotrichum destructivum]|uniref:Uncharacterized protein n=1 Tax=Colletotrichum destructivum TaxID=34406 RepID=A0AAX4I3K5_9PEZI|nr:hypothetical protein CDEST_02590 [Colletotrichum destructivum]
MPSLFFSLFLVSPSSRKHDLVPDHCYEGEGCSCQGNDLGRVWLAHLDVSDNPATEDVPAFDAKKKTIAKNSLPVYCPGLLPRITGRLPAG